MDYPLQEYQTFWRRLGASFIDCLIFLPTLYIWELPEICSRTELIFHWLLDWLLYLSYSVYFHGKYGQTIGKMVFKIKVLDKDKNEPIGFKRAILRDSLQLFADALILTNFLYATSGQILLLEPVRRRFDDISNSILIMIITIELLTMQFNYQRRSIHDYLAGSVVIKQGPIT